MKRLSVIYMPQIDENMKIQKITKLLEKGGTMLANHHGCGAPMFRYLGKVVCPVCDFPEEQEAKIEQELIITKPPLKKEALQSEAADNKRITRLIMNKIQSIAESLEGDTDLRRVGEKMDSIEHGIKIIKLLED